MSNYVVVGGGWSDQSSNGETFIRVKFLTEIKPGTTLTMWSNKTKSSEKHPDYKICAYVRDAKNPKEPANGSL